MKVAVIMGSDSDWDIMKKSAEVLTDFEIENEITVASAHRTPEKVHNFVKDCGADIFICAAGMAAHLAGVVASLTTKPVIGVPIQSEPFRGLDSLLSTVQMPSGIPVATVAVNGAKNAALLAVEILAVSDKVLAAKLADYRKAACEEVEQKSEKIQVLLRR